MIGSIIAWLQNLIKLIGPVGIGIATFIESFFAPIPSEPLLIGAGTTIQSFPELAIYILGATIGSFLGTLPFYLLGRKSKKYAYSFINKFGKYLQINKQDLEKTEKKFKKHGEIYIFTGRLVPIVRTLISIPAGIAKIDFRTYSLYTFLGSFTWNTLLIASGFIFRDKCQQLVDFMDQYETLTLGVILIFIFIILLNNILKNFKRYS